MCCHTVTWFLCEPATGVCNGKDVRLAYLVMSIQALIVITYILPFIWSTEKVLDRIAL